MYETEHENAYNCVFQLLDVYTYQNATVYTMGYIQTYTGCVRTPIRYEQFELLGADASIRVEESLWCTVLSVCTIRFGKIKQGLLYEL